MEQQEHFWCSDWILGSKSQTSIGLLRSMSDSYYPSSLSKLPSGHLEQLSPTNKPDDGSLDTYE